MWLKGYRHFYHPAGNHDISEWLMWMRPAEVHLCQLLSFMFNVKTGVTFFFFFILCFLHVVYRNVYSHTVSTEGHYSTSAAFLNWISHAQFNLSLRFHLLNLCAPQQSGHQWDVRGPPWPHHRDPLPHSCGTLGLLPPFCYLLFWLDCQAMEHQGMTEICRTLQFKGFVIKW